MIFKSFLKPILKACFIVKEKILVIKQHNWQFQNIKTIIKLDLSEMIS